MPNRNILADDFGLKVDAAEAVAEVIVKLLPVLILKGTSSSIRPFKKRPSNVQLQIKIK